MNRTYPHPVKRMAALLMTLLSCGMQLLGVSGWIDFAVGMVGLIVAACRTIPFKL